MFVPCLPMLEVGAMEAVCRAHNPEVRGLKPRSANSHFYHRLSIQIHFGILCSVLTKVHGNALLRNLDNMIV
jgi:hypothetical protein